MAIDDARGACQLHGRRGRDVEDMIGGDEHSDVTPPVAALDVDDRYVRDRDVGQSWSFDTARDRH